MASSPANFQIPVKQTPQIEPKSNSAQVQTTFLCEDIFSNSASSVRILSSCTSKRNLKLGSCIHAKILKSGLVSNVFVGNSLLDMYAKCGQIDDAEKLFEHMSDRTIVSWTSMMSGYCQNGAANDAISIFWQMLENANPNEYTLAVLLQACAQNGDPKFVQVVHCYIVKQGFVADNFLQNSLIDAYAKSGKLVAAEKLIERLSCRDVVSWTSVISGSVLNGMAKEALGLFIRMQEDGVLSNAITILSVLQACSLINEWRIFQWVHGLVMKAEFCSGILVVNSLVEMYSNNGYYQEGIQIFCEFCFTGEGRYLSPETMANLLQGCGHSGYLKLGEQIHGYLIKHRFLPCTVVENSLIHMYAENEQGDSAFNLFAKMSNRDIISWNTMIRCLVKNGSPYEALLLLSEIHSTHGEMISPDFVTVLTSIQACSNLASLQFGQVIHGYIIRAGLVCDIFVQNSLIDMYAKSGGLEFVEQMFEEMPVRDLGSWNSMIAAYGINGNGTSSLRVFTQLKKLGIHQFNSITFVNILSACAHAGMVKAGLEIFCRMEREYGVEPRMEHYACMVDLLGRSGRLEEAEAFIERMPIRPGPAVWGALLGACGLFGEVEIAERAAKRLSILEPDSEIWRVAMSNAYASVGRWEDAAKVRAEMRGSEGQRKEGGWSSVEVRGDMFRFMVGDTKHPESKMIYDALNGIIKHIKDATVADQKIA